MKDENEKQKREVTKEEETAFLAAIQDKGIREKVISILMSAGLIPECSHRPF